ncbi:MAG: hypothetical protein RL291_1717, partial [Pseudomonadota bacterium]
LNCDSQYHAAAATSGQWATRYPVIPSSCREQSRATEASNVRTCPTVSIPGSRWAIEMAQAPFNATGLAAECRSEGQPEASSGRSTRLAWRLEHFPPKWAPVRRKKMRQSKDLERGSDSVGSESALAAGRVKARGFVPCGLRGTQKLYDVSEACLISCSAAEPLRRSWHIPGPAPAAPRTTPSVALWPVPVLSAVNCFDV